MGVYRGFELRVWLVSQDLGEHFGGPNKKDYSILGSILGFPYFRETTIL